MKQSDLFFGHLTVRDQLTYTALLRLPSNWPRSKKTGEVDRIIKQLRLTKCQDTPIFQISGGEKKRVNIGSELLTGRCGCGVRTAKQLTNFRMSKPATSRSFDSVA